MAASEAWFRNCPARVDRKNEEAPETGLLFGLLNVLAGVLQATTGLSTRFLPSRLAR